MNINTDYTIRLGNRNIVKIMKGSTTIWEKSTTPVVTPDYFYLENVDSNSGNVSFTFNGTPSSDTIQQIEWSKDKTNWTPVTLVGYGTTNVSVGVGEKVYFRNSNGKCSNSYDAYLRFGSDINTNIGGELYTLLDYTNPNVSLPTKFAFLNLFYQTTKLIDASGLVLRWTTLAQDCYTAMFIGCTSLTTAPTLPATTLAYSCYQSMFKDCTALTTTPSLPATTLKQYCYSNMFANCSSLTVAPSLPATTLAQDCYTTMFAGCTSLTIAPALPVTTLANYCYRAMFANCSSLTVAPSLPATTLTIECYSDMFNGCSSLTTAPELPATTLVRYCYSGMFKYCSSLNSVTIYADDISATDCLKNWLEDVSATGTFYNNGSAVYTVDSASGIPTGWTEVKPSTGPDYFYIENVDSNSGDVNFTFNGTPSSYTIQQIEWSKDKTNWTTVTLVANTTTNVPVSVGEKVYFRNSNGKCTQGNNYLKFGSNINTNIGGELYTLLDYTDENVSLPYYAFLGLFYQMNKLKNASDLVLRWTTAPLYCYQGMFNGCTSLVSAPSLPATTLENDCYEYMFCNCTSLSTAPSLPATTLATKCYLGMFYGCTSLTTAPSLPATTSPLYCYQGMFYGCTSLTTAPSLPATTLEDYCYNSMFGECTSLTSAPELPATTLANNCYSYMFYNCTSLNSVTTYADDISASKCLTDWLKSVASTGTFHNLGSAIYPKNSTSGIPSGWTEVKS